MDVKERDNRKRAAVIIVRLGKPELREEHVAGSTAAREQRRCVLDFDVRGENQDRRIRVLLSDRPRSVETLRRVCWGHADVDYRNISAQLSNESHELGSVARLTDHLLSAPLEQARDALGHQYVVVRNDRSRGTRILLHHPERVPLTNRPSQAKPASSTKCPNTE